MPWSLRKADTGEVYPDRTFEEILCWAHSAQVNPMDEVSQDGKTWTLAANVPEFEMCWKVLLADGEEYGPTNIGTLREFIKANLLRPEGYARHVHDNSVHRIGQLLLQDSRRVREKIHHPGQPMSVAGTTPCAGLTIPKATSPEAVESSALQPAPKNPGAITTSIVKKLGPKIRDYHTQPLTKPAYLKVPPPPGTIFPKDCSAAPQQYETD